MAFVLPLRGRLLPSTVGPVNVIGDSNDMTGPVGCELVHVARAYMAL